MSFDNISVKASKDVVQCWIEMSRVCLRLSRIATRDRLATEEQVEEWIAEVKKAQHRIDALAKTTVAVCLRKTPKIPKKSEFMISLLDDPKVPF